MQKKEKAKNTKTKRSKHEKTGNVLVSNNVNYNKIYKKIRRMVENKKLDFNFLKKLKNSQDRENLNSILNKVIEEKWNSKSWEERNNVLYLIEEFDLKEQLGKVAVISFDKNNILSGEAYGVFKYLTEEKFGFWLSTWLSTRCKKDLEKIKKDASNYIEKLWNSRNLAERTNAINIIKEFNLKTEEILHKLAVLSFDSYLDIKDAARATFYEQAKESIEEWLKDKENLKKAKKAASSYVKNLWNSKYPGERQSATKIIKIFKLKELLPELIILTFGDNLNAAEKALNELTNENIEEWLENENNFKKAKKAASGYVKNLWNSNDSLEREGTAGIIGKFKLDEHLDKLVVLALDEKGYIQREAEESLRKFKWEELSNESKKKVNKIIEKKWNSKNHREREIMAEMIGIFKLEKHLDKLIALTQDGAIIVEEKAEESLRKFKWGELNKETKEKVDNIIEEKWNSKEYKERRVIAEIIALFKLKKHLDKLIILALDENPDVEKQAIKSLNEFSFNYNEIEQYFEKLSKENKNKIIRGIGKHPEIAKELAEECSPLLYLITSY